MTALSWGSQSMDNNGQQWITMDNNGQQSAVLHASLMPFSLVASSLICQSIALQWLLLQGSLYQDPHPHPLWVISHSQVLWRSFYTVTLSGNPSILSHFLGDLLYFHTFWKSFYICTFWGTFYTFTLSGNPSILSNFLEVLLFFHTFWGTFYIFTLSREPSIQYTPTLTGNPSILSLLFGNPSILPHILEVLLYFHTFWRSFYAFTLSGGPSILSHFLEILLYFHTFWRTFYICTLSYSGCPVLLVRPHSFCVLPPLLPVHIPHCHSIPEIKLSLNEQIWHTRSTSCCWLLAPGNLSIHHPIQPTYSTTVPHLSVDGLFNTRLSQVLSTFVIKVNPSIDRNIWDCISWKDVREDPA